MTPERFRQALATLHWNHGDLADVLHVLPETARRWMRGAAPVPPAISGWLEQLVELCSAPPQAPPTRHRSAATKPERTE